MNHLSDESSPYLLQHAANPVDWHPWGEEAFGLAAELDRPVFLSIGYSTCHWCHVMAEESFEDDRVAALMNASFVCVKVDREERPDVDSLYMSAAQAMTGGGGWPLNVLLTPEGKPFYAATYIPRSGDLGRVGMLELLPSIARAWKDRRQEIEETAERMASILAVGPQRESEADSLDEGAAAGARDQLAGAFDEANGGFGGKPRFPMAHRLLFLVRHHRRTGDRPSLEMAVRTLRAIHSGGVYDQLGGGVHRYSTDRQWHLPHFEKMLYDQALLALAAVEAWKVDGDSGTGRLAEDTLNYCLGRLRHPEGGFFSAEDADSPGGEGAFYTWTFSEMRRLLSPGDFRLATKVWGVRESGNYRREATGELSGRNVLDVVNPPGPGSEEAARLSEIARQLLEARGARPAPALDDKVLTDWNGLMVAALARAGSSFGRGDYLRAAGEAADFVEEHLRGRRGRLLHRWRDGVAGIDAFADDYAFLAWGLLELHQALQDHGHLERAVELMDVLEKSFRGEGRCSYRITSGGGRLPSVPHRLRDGALPSAGSVALQNLHRLWRLTGRSRFRKAADRLLREYSAVAADAPTACTMAMAALEEMLEEPVDVVVCGEPGDPATAALLEQARGASGGSALLLLREPEDALLSELAPHTSGIHTVDGRPAAYVCRGFSCRLPITDPHALGEALG
jgi:hypothetical protein